MKKIYSLFSLLLSFVLIFSLTACSSSTPTGEGETTAESGTSAEAIETLRPQLVETLPVLIQKDIQYPDDYSGTGSCFWRRDYVLLSDSDSRFEKTMDTLNELKRRQSSQADIKLEGLEELAAEDPDGTYFQKTQAFVRRADTQVLSILYVDQHRYGDKYSDAYSFEGLNFDPLTGELITPGEVISDEDAMWKACVEQLKLYYPEWGEKYKPSRVTGMSDEEMSEVAWVLDPYGLTLIFPKGLIAKEAEGIFTVTLPFAQYKDLLNQSYADVPDSYSVMLSDVVPYYCDIHQNGTLEQIRYKTQTSHDMINRQTITIAQPYDQKNLEKNEISSPEDINCSDTIPLLLNDRGVCCIAVELEHEDTSRETEIFSIDKDEALVTDCIGAGFLRTSGDTDGSGTDGAIVLPKNMNEIQAETDTTALGDAS